MISTDKTPLLKTFAQRFGQRLGLRIGQSSRKNRIITISAIGMAVLAFGAAGVAPLAPDAAELPIRSISQELALPDIDAQLYAMEDHPQSFVREEKIRSGDTLAALLNRLGVDDAAAATFIKNDATARVVMRLPPGRRVQVQTGADGSLQWLSAPMTESATTALQNLVIRQNNGRFAATQTSAPLERRVEMHAGMIRSSLFAATDAAQIPDNVAKQIIDMFSTDIDFASDLQRGDRFNVVYETFWQNGEFVRAGRILAGEFRNAGTAYRTVWFDEPNSRTGGGYYSFDGKSLKKAFLKSPLAFTRISSGFSMRMHPVLGKWKKHEGVDFAAPVGTPIRTSGDGVIEFAGTQNGYGNVVVVRHWSNYSTAYAHMSRFGSGLRKGMKVSQGDLIGYVGTTGWSTGPHLHYEFRVNNQPRDPLAVDVVSPQPMTAAERQRFQIVAADMLHRFDLLGPTDNMKLAAR